MEDLKQKIFDILLNYTYENRTTAAEEIAKLFHEETQQGPIWVRLHDYKFKETGHHPYRYRTTENDEYDYGEIYVADDSEGVFFDVDHENDYEPQSSNKWVHYEILDESQPNEQPAVEQKEWDSERMIGRVKDRFKELEKKEFEWRSFYNGWIEGRSDMLQQIKGWGEYNQQKK